MEIRWDPRKDLINRRKHGLSFELAQHVFDDPLHLSSDAYEENGEWRFDTLGRLFGGLLVIVAHTWHMDEEGEHIRLISARKADKTERIHYENAPPYR